MSNQYRLVRKSDPLDTPTALKKQSEKAVSDASDKDTYENYHDIPINEQRNIQINNTSEIIYKNEEWEMLNVELIINYAIEVTQPKRGCGWQIKNFKERPNHWNKKKGQF